MIIFCARSQTVSYRDSDGVVQIVALRPGRHNYPMLKASDVLLAETLRVLRKHKHVAFDDLLQSDKDILKVAPDGVDKAAYLVERTTIKPSPKGRKAKPRLKEKKEAPESKKEAPESKKEAPNVAARPRQENQSPHQAPKSGSGGEKSGKVSDKG